MNYGFDIDKRKRKAYFLNISNRFFSICRKIDFTNQNTDVINYYIELYRQRHEEYTIENYITMLKELSVLIYEEKVSDSDAMTILLNVIDPELDMYSIYEEKCTKDEIKTEIRKKFGFYDYNFLAFERKYVKDNNLESELKWEYKKEN